MFPKPDTKRYYIGVSISTWVESTALTFLLPRVTYLSYTKVWKHLQLHKLFITRIHMYELYILKD